MVLDALRGRGLLYPCFCSRADIARAAAAPHGPDGDDLPGHLPHPARRHQRRSHRGGRTACLAAGRGRAAAAVGPLGFTDRTHGRMSCDRWQGGDVVLGRRDAAASYHLCVTHDDAVQGVTLVTRGEDLLGATAVHRLLQAVMGWPEPHYAHHRLLLDGAGRRLAKRDGAVAVHRLRVAGHSPAAVLALAAGSPHDLAPT